ncbi:hnRNP A1-gamma isoform [Russula emetica]|nr:hnRNP A1-gamma isoform [Russula emetica]
MAKVESTEDNLYDGLYGDEFEEDFAVSALGNPSNITDSNADDGNTDFIEPPEDSSAAPEPEVPQPIPTLDSKPRINADALPPKPNTTNNGSPLSYSAQVAEQFSSSYRQTPSQERGRLDAARLAQFNSTGANSTDGQARPVRPSEMKDEGKMFVGGLSWDTTDEGLRNYFSEFGKVDACTIVRDADGKSRGFAFLTFEDPASVNAVMVREHFLDGKAIDPKRAIPREEHLRNTRYFVGGLAPQTTADTMRVFFTKFGKVVDATVMVDRETGRSKGFGFVTFEDNSSDSQLVGKLGLILDEKQIEVKTAQPRSQRDQQRHHVAPPSNNFSNGQAAASSPAAMGNSMPFMPMNNSGTGDMSMMYQRMMNGMGTPYNSMMGGGMGMMGGFNPMMGMGMGMGRFGMGGMGGAGGVGAMNPMATAGSMGGNMGMGGGVGGMRLGMGPIGMTGAGAGMGGMGAGGMGAAAAAMGGGGMGMGLRQNMGMMGAAGRGRPGINQGPGPARVTNRGQHGFHPYARFPGS